MKHGYMYACIQDVTQKPPKLTHSSDHYPFLLIYVGTNDTARNDTEQIGGDFEALSRRIKKLGGKMVLLSILPVQGRGPGKDHCIIEVNTLRWWYQHEGLGFIDNG